MKWPFVFERTSRSKLCALALTTLTVTASTHPATAQEQFTLTPAERQTFGGTFGINFSHYDFDRDKDNPDCQKLPGYNAPACSCTIDWRKVSQSGLEYAYLKATDGTKRDLAFLKNWDALLIEHKDSRLYRGAYHFLRPTGSAAEQAQAFLSAIGAASGRRPTQLSPVLDIEWSKAAIEPGSAEDRACLERFRSTENGKLKCDMWHTKAPQQIVDLAADWIDRVERATGKTVTIYTNKSWWDDVIKDAGREIMRDQPVWIAAYRPSGPSFKPTWGNAGGGQTWGMPPLPVGAAYPKRTYATPHFWQFTESARINTAAYTCAGRTEEKDAELNWLPVKGPAFRDLFGAP